VQLPASLPAWTNLWEPLDPLAFLAGTVFQLPNGGRPVDVTVSHHASDGWWTHSSYWELGVVARDIADALEPTVTLPDTEPTAAGGTVDLVSEARESSSDGSASPGAG
jgi:hypothetical protein